VQAHLFVLQLQLLRRCTQRSTTVLTATLLHHTLWHTQHLTVMPNTCSRSNQSPTARTSACTDSRRAGATTHRKSRRVLPLHVCNKQALCARRA